MTQPQEADGIALAGALLSTFAQSASLGSSERGAIGDRLMVSLLEAHARWPSVSQPPEHFARYVGEKLPSDVGDLLASLEALELSDLYLACACIRGVPAALEVFDSEVLTGLEQTLKFFQRGAVFVDDVRQLLRERLLVEKNGRPGKLATYSGRGLLSSWVNVVAQRIAFELIGSSNPILDSSAPEPVSEFVDPELAHIRARFQPEFQAAFRAALAALSDRDKVLLRLNLLGRVSHERLGLIYGVNQSTVSRWLAAARDTVRAGVLRELSGRLGLGAADVESVIRVVNSDLDLSLARVLGQDSISTKSGSEFE